MTCSRKLYLVAATTFGLCCCAISPFYDSAIVAQAADKVEAPQVVSEKERLAYESGLTAYIHGYPLVLVNQTKAVITNFPRVFGGPTVNQLTHRMTFPNAQFKFVTCPNADTLYSAAWLDLKQEPQLLHSPDTNDRYFVVQILDGWTDLVASLGKRTTGTKAADYLIAGPTWNGDVPPNVTLIKSPTNMVWVLARTQTNGRQDDPAVWKLQKQYDLRPLSAIGTTYFPPSIPIDGNVDIYTAPVEQVEKMEAEEFFRRLLTLITENPAAPEEQTWLAPFKSLGLTPGTDFPWSSLDEAAKTGLERAVRDGRKRILSPSEVGAAKKHGWQTNLKHVGRFENDFQNRAYVARNMLAVNQPEDAVYPQTEVDEQGQQLTGKHNYVLHFPKGQTPPANAFWSVTLYGKDRFFYPNPQRRFALGDRDSLKFNADGSLTFRIQHQSPGPEEESNWLPAPLDNFNLMLRVYWPKPEVLNGSWSVPAVQRVD